MVEQRVQAEQVAVRAEARNHTDGNVRQERLPPRGLSRENVRQVDFYERDLHREERVPDRDRGVSVRGSIDQRTICVPVELVHELHELTLMVGLMPDHLEVLRRGVLANGPLDVVQRLAAVHMRLSCTEKIEVGPVQNSDAHLGLEALKPVPKILLFPPFVRGCLVRLWLGTRLLGAR